MSIFLYLVGILVGGIGTFLALVVSQNNLHTIIGLLTMNLGAIFFIGGAIVGAIQAGKKDGPP